MFNKKWLTGVLTVVLLVALAGCAAPKPLAGKYYYEDSSGKLDTDFFVEFSPNGNPDMLVIVAIETDHVLPCTYKIDGNTIRLTHTYFTGEEVETFSFSQKGNSVFIDGKKFTKK